MQPHLFLDRSLDRSRTIAHLQGKFRYLRGLLSAYDVLIGPFAGTVCEEDVWKVDALLA